MPPDTSNDLDYPTKQSPGYMFLRLLIIQVIFVVFCIAAILIPDKLPDVASIPGLYITRLDVGLILVGIACTFVLFVLTFAAWQYNEYRVSVSKLYIKRSFLLAHTTTSINVSSIQHVIMKVTLAGKLLNYATIYVYTSETGHPIRLYGVPFAEHFLAYLKAQTLLSRHRTDKLPTKNGTPVSKAHPAQ